MSDPLIPILEAYRQENSPNGIDSKALERRILASRAKRRPIRRNRNWLLAIAAVLGASAVLAAAGQRTSTDWDPVGWSRTAADALELPAGSTPLPPSASGRTPVGSQVNPLPSSEQLPQGDALAPPLAALAPTQGRHRTLSQRAGQRSIELKSHDAAPDLLQRTLLDTGGEDLALYRAAQRLHVTGAPPQRSLEAWNRYLERFPHGLLAAEARFNRARCLARLGRSAEAASELEPFARGAFGSYRRTHADTLMRALERAN